MDFIDQLANLEELRRGGALTEEEFAQAKATLLGDAGASAGDVAHRLDDVFHQQALDRMNREWGEERKRYLVKGRESMHEPTKAMGMTNIVGGVVMFIVFSVFLGFLGLAVPVGQSTHDRGMVMWIGFCVLWMCFVCGLGIVHGYRILVKAAKYREAFEAHRQRLATLEARRAGGQP